jgi:two-component system chemotaxis sensor kinase CheA
MGELLREFLKQTVFNLETLQSELLGKGKFSEDFLRRLFRQLHTIKGTSNTFNLIHLAHLAHEIENILQAVQTHQIAQNEETILIFQNGLKHLHNLANDYLEKSEAVYPQLFADEVQKMLPAEFETQELLSHQIPDQFISPLSAPEKTNLDAALRNGKRFYLLEAFFEFSVFDQEFKRLKQILSENGEIIAVASAVSENPLKTIGFQMFLVTDLAKKEIEKIISEFCTKIIFENSPIAKNFADNLGGLLANLVTDGEKTAQILNKRVVFETSFTELKVSAKMLILLNEIGSHLIHNAIDHGIETIEKRTQNGKNPIAKIEINLSTAENILLFQIKDDGKGLDLEKITNRAKEKGLIPSDQILAEKQAIELIFTQGFSTSQTVSEISGRGVGLDAVNDLVESSGGRIEVETKLGKGTIFSVYLPQK